MVTEGKYILNERGEAVPERDLFKWAQWFEKEENRRVLRTRIDDAEVSTVFLGLDQNFLQGGPPVLWESLIFGGRYNREMRRYRSREDAIVGHFEMVDMCRAAQREA
jgi:hypothetical protein